MRIRVTCPHCDREFDVNAPIMPTGSSVSKAAPQYPTQPPTTPTRRGIASVDAPIREGASTCAACGLTPALHEGDDNLAWVRYGCDGFLARRGDE